MYDAYLGGKDNYPADREAVRQILRTFPEVRGMARANRAFMQRAVRYLTAEAGIRQFLDIGTGIPTAGNVHQVAGQAAPGAHVVYVDNDHCKSGCAHTGVTFPSVRVVPCGCPVVPPLKDLEWWGLQKGVRSRRVLARKPSRSPGRYCIRLSWVFTRAVSWGRLRLARLARDLLRCDHTSSVGLS